MSAFHETLIVEAGGRGVDALTPGDVQRALALGAGVAAEEIGTIVPLARGRVAVDIAATRALTLATPRALSFRHAGRQAVLALRREDDPPGEELGELTLSWRDNHGPPSPGALAQALASSLGASLGAEDLGPAWVADGWMRVTLPAAVLLSAPLPDQLPVGDRSLTLEHSGKKKP